jgi:hypothetical protein
LKVSAKQKEAREVLEQTLREKATLENQLNDLLLKNNEVE